MKLWPHDGFNRALIIGGIAVILFWVLMWLLWMH
jgi:hypothetical protein